MFRRTRHTVLKYSIELEHVRSTRSNKRNMPYNSSSYFLSTPLNSRYVTAAVAEWLERPPHEFDPWPPQIKVFKTGSSGFPPWHSALWESHYDGPARVQDNGLVKY